MIEQSGEEICWGVYLKEIERVGPWRWKNSKEIATDKRGVLRVEEGAIIV